MAGEKKLKIQNGTGKNRKTWEPEKGAAKIGKEKYDARGGRRSGLNSS